MIGPSGLAKDAPHNESLALSFVSSQAQTPHLVSLASIVAFEGLTIPILGRFVILRVCYMV